MTSEGWGPSLLDWDRVFEEFHVRWKIEIRESLTRFVLVLDENTGECLNPTSS